MEYLDKDEMRVAHTVQDVDAFIKVSQGWPLSSPPLNLIALKSSDQHSKGISSSFLSKVKVVFFCIYIYFLFPYWFSVLSMDVCDKDLSFKIS